MRDDEWKEDGSCRESDPELWYPERENNQQKNVQDAKKICRGCPVRWLCLEWALKRGERFGVWGGLTAPERERMAKNRRRRLARERAANSDLVA